MKKEDKNTGKNVIKKEEKRLKNAAEKFVVFLCWLCFFMAIFPFVVLLADEIFRYNLSNLFYKIAMHYQWTMVFLFALILILHLFHTSSTIISKHKKIPCIRPIFYRNLLIILWIIFVEIWTIHILTTYSREDNAMYTDFKTMQERVILK